MKTYKFGGAGPDTPAPASNESNHDDSTGETDVKQAKPLPLHAFNDTMRAVAEATAEVHQIPIELPAMAAVAVMSGAMGKAFELTGAVNGKTSFGGVYVIAGAPKSHGKGAASSIASPLLLASQEIGREFRENDLSNLKVEKKTAEKESEALYRQICNGKATEDEKEKFKARLRELQRKIDAVEPLLTGLPTYWVSNTTSEGMAIQFARNNCSLFAFSPEAGEAVRVMMGKYNSDKGKGDFDLWLSGYTVEPFRTDRVQRGALEIIPCLSALLFCQPCVVREVITNEEAFERGLTARTLPFIVESELKEDDGVPRSIAASTSGAWDALIRGVLSIRGKPGDAPRDPRRIVCSEGAREVFRAFHNESIRLRNGKYRDIEGELGRWRENAIRLAVGQCVADDLNATELSEAQAIRAVELARWCVHQALAIMNAGRMERRLKRARELQSLIVDYRLLGKAATLRDLNNSNGFKPDEVRALAADFPHLLIYSERETGGRPSAVVSIPASSRDKR